MIRSNSPSRRRAPAAAAVYLTACVALMATGVVQALAPAERVENFRLPDHLGASHELYRLSDATAIVFMVQGNGCPIVRNAMPRLRELRDEYAARGVEFRLLNANLQDHRDSVAREARDFGYDIPILIDETQIIGDALGLVRTGEVFVIDPEHWTIAYHGALDDRLTYENQKTEARHHYLADALDDMLADQPVAVPSTNAVGCLINFPERKRHSAHAAISYSEAVAPVLLDKCVNCHRPGGIGPWAMTGYDMVHGFAPMIREVLRTQRMPPWHADPQHGEFANDRSLSTTEIRTLVHWIEAGSPRGAGPDPLAEQTRTWPEWALGAPDLVIDIPSQDVPATGTVEYQYPTVRNPLDRDVWVRAAEIIPGDRKALHHVITFFAVPDADGRLTRHNMRTLGGYVPGASADVFPADTGVLLPAGAVFRLQMHYTSYGKATTDASRLGIYLHDEPPAHHLAGTVLMNTRIRIPANTRAHTESASEVLTKNVLLYSLLPHAHFRGSASEFVAVYPDGVRETLLSVPNYDFNWQTTYELAEPKVLPAGTKIIHTTTWDNSATNPANPDPNRTVAWGEQSWDEMLFGSLTFRYLDDNETPATRGRTNLAAGPDAGR